MSAGAPLPVPDLLSDATSPVISSEDAARVASLRGSSAAAASAAVPGAVPAPADEEPYYWEPEGNPNAPMPVLVVHNVHYALSRVWATAEYVGDFFAEMFGLYNSRYEWALELDRRHREEAEEAEMLETRRREWEAREQRGGVGGGAASGPTAAASQGVVGAGAGGTGLGNADGAALLKAADSNV
jgi:hypothetical protein